MNTAADGSWLLYDGGNGMWNVGLNQRNGLVGVGGPVTTTGGHLQVRGSTGRTAVHAISGAANHAVRGYTMHPSVAILGLVGPTDTVFGISNGAALMGINEIGGTGVFARTTTGPGINSAVVGQAIGTGGTGVYGQGGRGGLAGHFIGNVTITGTLSKGGGSFTIDHPLDPANKVLQHSFVESPDMMNVYNGNVTLDASGEAGVTLPDWFEALNRDFRYQLTAIGAPAPNLYVAAKVSGNRFKIAGGTPSGEVSWQVTGIRQNAWANAYRIAVEQTSRRASAAHTCIRSCSASSRAWRCRRCARRTPST